jgi:hypothetical protein
MKTDGFVLTITVKSMDIKRIPPYTFSVRGLEYYSYIPAWSYAKRVSWVSLHFAKHHGDITGAQWFLVVEA